MYGNLLTCCLYMRRCICEYTRLDDVLAYVLAVDAVVEDVRRLLVFITTSLCMRVVADTSKANT